jgi:ketosteroid isomerase-like protein
MKRRRMTLRVIGGALLATITIGSCSDMTARVGIDPELLAARETAWRAYFAGDVKALGDLLPPEFIGIGMTDGPFTGRAQTLDEARAFQQKGGRLVRLAFPETQAQQFGDVIVLYGRYEAVIQSDGAERTVRGRLTEVFVRRDGKWLHPGWHLDTSSGPRPAQ